ncbi:MAG: ATP-binding protein [Rickettsiales bacterium]|nr:ATP-binding protein [Rickettsiales bacterium]
MQFFTLLLSLVLCSFSAQSRQQTEQHAVQRDFYFDNVSLEQGLNQASVYSLANDQYGFTWIGTQDGLHRFDGNTVTLVDLSPSSLPKYRYIRDIKAFAEHLFVATLDGLVVVNQLSGDIRYADLSGAGVYSIAQVKDTYWLGTDRGIYVLDNALQIRAFYGGQSSPQALPVSFCDNLSQTEECHLFVRKILYDPAQDKIWLSANNALFSYSSKEQQFTARPFSDDPTQKNHIQDMLLDNNNRLWLGTDNGLHILDQAGASQHIYEEPYITDSLSSNRILTLAIDNENTLWVGTRLGLNYRSLNAPQSLQKGWTSIYNNNLSNHSLLSNTVRKISLDDAGRIWIGTNRGLSVTNLQRKQVAIYRATDSQTYNNYILSLTEQTSGALWVGTLAGLYKFDGVSAMPIPELAKDVIYDSLQIDNFLWVAARNNLYQIDLLSHKVIQHFDETNSPIGAAYNYKLAMKDGVLWVGSSAGLISFDITEREWHVWGPKHTLGRRDIYTLYINENTIFIGTGSGLSTFDLSNHQFRHFDELNSGLKIDWVFDITPWHDDQYFIATDGGVYIFDVKLHKFEYLGITRGNAYSVLLEITTKEQQDETLWVTSNNGVYRYSIKTGLAQVFKEEHGLSSNEHNLNAALLDSQNRLVLGTINGFVVFEPETFISNEVPFYSRVISSVDYAGKTYALWQKVLQITSRPLFLTTALDLDWTVEHFTLTFNQPYFGLATPEATNIDYRNTNLSLSRLANGQFDIPLSDKPGDVLNVVKKGHPLLSTLAYISYLIVVSLLVFLLLKWLYDRRYTRMLLDKNRMISEQHKQIKQHLSFKENLYLQIQHSFKSPVFASIGLSKQIDKRLQQNNPLSASDIDSLKRKNHKLQNALTDTSELIDELLQLSKQGFQAPELTDQPIRQTIMQTIELIQPIAHDSSVFIEVDIAQSVTEELVLNAPEKALFLIIENVLTNAIKFSEQQGIVTLYADVKEHTLRINIRDQGCGFDEQDLDKIFQLHYRSDSNSYKSRGSGVGLTNVKSLLDLLNGSIEFVTKNNEKGTNVWIHIPFVRL